eukprot:GGOE01001877.1.p1 GENE.GGOE01001877.1~~GGOE01001877.1.p1  ORF type:complete len:418 (-),score=20.76 GGOE01001877.1:93-1232(-)
MRPCKLDYEWGPSSQMWPASFASCARQRWLPHNRLQSQSVYTWILVVPGFRDRNSWDNYEFNSLLNLTILAQGTKMKLMTTKDYWAKQSPTSVDLVWVQHNSDWTMEESKERPKKCPDASSGFSEYHRYDFQRRQVWYNDRMVTFKSVDCWVFKEIVHTRNSKMVTLLEEAAQNARSILLPALEKVTPYWTEWDRKGYWREKAHIRWVDKLERWADEFIAQMPDRGNFISIHMRRGDFKTAHREDFSTPEEIATLLYPRLLQFNSRVVFMATDGTRREVADVRQALKFLHPMARLVTYKPERHGATGLKQTEVAAMDKVLAARGKFFLGTAHSYFSSVIHFARKAAGLPFTLGSQFSRDRPSPLCIPPDHVYDCSMLPW